LRERVAAEEGVPADLVELVRGGNESQMRDSAIGIHRKLGRYGSPSLASAIAAQRRAQAERNSRMNH
jgi:hypothetical protein